MVKAKLKERQFYNVAEKKREMVPAEFIRVVQFKNGAHALYGLSKFNDKMFKLISDNKLAAMEKKYGKSKKYRKSM